MRIYPDKTVDEEFKDLGDLGYTGSLNDRQFAFLTAQGLFGALADKFSQWSGEEASGTLTIDTLTYLRGTAGVAPTLTSGVTPTGTTSANYITTGVFAATAQTKAQIDASPNKFTITKGTITFSGEPVEIDNSVTAGVVSAYMQDSSDPAIVSNVATDSPVTYDSEAPTFSSAEVGTVDATSLIVTFNKALYGSTSAADWDVQVNASPATESAAVISGSTVDITLGAAVSNGDTVTVAYTGTGLVGVDAEVVATFTAQSVTNNVAAAPTGVAVEQTQVYSDSGFLSSYDLTLPAGITDGNKLLLILSQGFQKTPTTPTGWALEDSNNTALGDTYIYSRTASGDSSATVTVALSATGTIAASFYEISCPTGGIDIAWASLSEDPPSLTPAGGSAEYAWICGAVQERSNNLATAAPSGYAGLLNALAQTGSTSGGNCQQALAHKVATLASDDPGTFTWSGASSFDDVAFTIAVR